MAAPAETAAQQPVSAQVVGNAFVQQYYHILHHSPSLVHRFYQDISRLGRPEEDGTMNVTTTMQAIDEKIVSLNYTDFRAEIKSVDAQESLDGGVHVFVTGYLTGKDTTIRNFAQTFFLAPQDRGYFVLNDMFRYLDSPFVSPALVNDVVSPALVNDVVSPALVNDVMPLVTDESVADPVEDPVEASHVSEQSLPSVEEAITEEADMASENGNGPVVEQEGAEEEIPVAEVVDEVQDDAHVVDSSAKIEEVPKKSFASIVRHLKESGATIAPAPPTLKRAPLKQVEQVKPTFAPVTDGAASSFEAVDNGNNQDGEADGHSIYIKGLPMNATDSMLEEVFAKFGTIKNEGIQVRSNKQQGFCFGFVEFEEASSVQKALEASPVAIGGRQAFVEEKRSTNSRGNSNRVRFQSGRGSGNRGGRGGRGYNYSHRGDFRNEYGGNRNSFQNSNGGGGRVKKLLVVFD